MSPSYRLMAVDYHLLKRKTTKDKTVYYLAVLSDVIDKNGKWKHSAVRSTGARNLALARKRAVEMLAQGRVLSSKENLRDFLPGFWNFESSEYLRDKRAEGVELSRQYCTDNIRRLLSCPRNILT